MDSWMRPQDLRQLIRPCREMCIRDRGMEARNYLMSQEYDPQIFEERYPDFYRMAGHSIHEVLDALGMPLKAQHILSSYWCYLGAPEDQMDFMTYSTMLLLSLIHI